MSEHFVVVNKAGEVVPQSLVTADELARLCATLNATNYVDAPFRVVRTYTQDELDAAVAAEREACALVCDGIRHKGYVPPEDGAAASYYDSAAEECADAIRARREQ